MFSEESLILTFEYIGYIFILPTLLILILDHLYSHLTPHVFSIYAGTGLIGTPIHELGHAAGCVIFGMRIVDLKLYSPDRETGRLGYCNFAYNPHSTMHSIGLVVQGIAPMLFAYGIFIVIVPWGAAPKWVLDGLQLSDASSTMEHALASASAIVLGNLHNGPRGFLWCVLSLIIGMHCIPSWADIRIATKGMFTLLAIAIGFSGLSQIDLSFLPPGILHAIEVIQRLLSNGFFWVLEQIVFAITIVAVVGIVGSFTFLLIPALVAIAIRRVTGAPAPTGAPKTAE